MEFLRLAAKYISRQRVRTILTMFAVAISIAALFSILSYTKGFEKRIGRELHRVGIDFMIVPVGCPYEVASLILSGVVTTKVYDESIVPLIRKTEGIELASPMLAARLPNPIKERVDIVYGYEMDYIKKIKPEWKINGKIPSGFVSDDVIVGSELTEKDGLKIGDKMEYPNIGKTFTVVGILEKTASNDDAFIFTHLKVAQEVLIKTAKLPVQKSTDPLSCCNLIGYIFPEPITGVAVKLKDPALFEQVADKLNKNLPGIQIVTISQIMQRLADLAASARVLSLAIVAIALLISAGGVMNSILMAVFERIPEIGIMRAIGASKADIFRIVIEESIL
ncbi:MAG: ABC transporter permease, partial [Nitrospirae bacterium]|nr:ABC transporter permease [Nitrospirota bacterium]